MGTAENAGGPPHRVAAPSVVIAGGPPFKRGRRAAALDTAPQSSQGHRTAHKEKAAVDDAGNGRVGAVPRAGCTIRGRTRRSHSRAFR